MTAQQQAARRSRPWIIPPASARPSGQFIRGTEILTELTGSFRILLWLLYRDLELSVSVEPERRAGLFRTTGLGAFENLALPEPIARHVRTLGEVLADISPARAAACCAAIAAWARPHAPRTALLFAETAARAHPASAGLARDVALHALACGLAREGEAWQKRAIAIARRSRDWSTYAHLYVDRAEIAYGTGDLDPADRHFRRALRVFRRMSLGRDIRARAAVGLFRCALREGDRDAADRMARLAVRSFERGDRRAAGVRLEIGQALMEGREYARVLDFLHPPRAAGAGSAEPVALAALRVRAAALLGDSDSLDAAWNLFVVAADRAEPDESREIAETVTAILGAIGSASPPGRLGTILAEAARLAHAARP